MPPQTIVIADDGTITLYALRQVDVLSVGDTAYRVVDGCVAVPAQLAGLFLEQGFSLVPPQPADAPSAP